MEFQPFKIGKYLLLEKLATGGMAEVYRAKASGAGGFEKQLAVKRILPTYSSNEEFRRMFEYEARLSSLLSHANIVHIYDFVKAGDTYLLAMEYVHGKNLRQFINKAKKTTVSIPLEFGIFVINEVCKGLEYAHKKRDDVMGRPLNIIHRDMSPQNIMLSYDGAVKIVDFGIAKARDRVDETRSGVIKGKFGYMSPEQANGLPVDHRTDIFSTAIILFELLTGKRLFAAENDMATLKMIQDCVIPNPSRLNPKITVELEHIVARGLTKDVKSRYQDAGLLHRHLQEYLNKHYPSFTQREVGEILTKVFTEDIALDKKRIEQIHRQSIPFSQQGNAGEDEASPLSEVDEVIDGPATRSEIEVKTGDTLESLSQLGIEKMGENSSIKDEASKKADNQIVENQMVSQDPLEKTLTPEHGIMDENAATNNEVIIPLDPSIPPPPKNKTRSTLHQDPSKHSAPSLSSRIGLRTLTPASLPHPPRAPNTTPEPTPDSHVATPTPTQSSTPLPLPKEGPQEMGSGRIRLVAIEEPKWTTDDLKERSVLQSSRRQIDKLVQESRREKKDSSLSFLTLLIATGITGSVYYYYVLKNPLFTPTSEPSPPVATRSIPPIAEPARVPTGDCSLLIDSDPVGAKIFIDGKLLTSTLLSGPCNTAMNVTWKLEGHEVLTENVVLENKKSRIFRTLKKIPMGRLSLRLDRNARIYLDNKLLTEARSDVPVEIPLRARMKHRLRFVNDVLKIDTLKEFAVEEGQLLQQNLSLEEHEEPSRSVKKRR